MRAILAPFIYDGRVSRGVLAAFLAVNAIVAINVLTHDRRVGYDADHHIDYVHALGRGVWPTIEETREFYAAPLPYLIPAALPLLGVSREAVVEKAAQVLNLAYSVVLTYFLVRLCRHVRPADPRFAAWALVLLGTLPVFQRTMAFIRGEPLEAALAVVACERLLAAIERPARSAFLGVGLWLGLLMLAKQWGAFVIVALALFLLLRAWAGADAPRRWLINAALIAATALPIGGAFYFYFYARFGSVIPFDHPTTLSLSNRPREFYTDFGGSQLFVSPIRETFSLDDPPVFFPVMYSDTWGDYWFYFLVSGNDPASGIKRGDEISSNPLWSNRDDMRPVLARANAAGLLPTGLCLLGVAIGIGGAASLLRRRQLSLPDQALVSCSLVVMSALLGYFALLMLTPKLDVKASYALHAFPFAAVVAAAALSAIADRERRAGRVLQIALALVVIHNLPLLFSRYSIFGGFDGIPRNFT